MQLVPDVRQDQWPVLRPFQKDALVSLYRHDHTVLMAPTGAGKSLVFQRYLYERSSTRAVLVTPLVALGRQQVQRFQDLSIPAWCGVGDQSQVRFPDRQFGVWVVSPERLMRKAEQLFTAWKPDFFIFDEAHCIFEWGDAFRPSFRSVLDLFKRYSISKTFWCSATLRPEMISAIRDLCGPKTQVLGKFQIPKNIELQRLKVSAAEKLEWVEWWLDRHAKHSGIVYVGTRTLADRLAKFLKANQRTVWVYHAGMSAEERRILEKKIDEAHEQKTPFVLVATSAFGMGMDYPGLRFAILFDPPYSVLQLAQGLGRVGRSGLQANVFLLWNDYDFLRLGWMTAKNPKASSELARLQAWYRSSAPPRESLEKDFD